MAQGDKRRLLVGRCLTGILTLCVLLGPASSFTLTLKKAALYKKSSLHRLTDSVLIRPQRRNSSLSLYMSLKHGNAACSNSGPLHQSARSVDEVPATFLPDGVLDEEHRAMLSSLAPETNQSNMRRTLNALLLGCSFGWALYTILRVDAGMTRGWTHNEIMMRIPVDNWQSYEFKLSESPMETKTAINVIIYLLGDWMSQTFFQKKNILDFDAARTLKNGFIGLCFGPLVHLYYEFSDTILPIGVDDSMMNRVYKIIMDQTIYLAVKCSIYIMAVGVLNGSTVDEAAGNVKARLKGIMFTAWSFWPLVHCVTYTVIPARHRILWVNCVDLIWNAILASKTAANSDATKDAESQLQPYALSEEDGSLQVLINEDMLDARDLSSNNQEPIRQTIEN